ncbi:MAG: hypothetical protein R3C53_11685 [Pirellulaceae bacterium]
MRLELANPDKVASIDASYHGGMRVTSVRTNSPADLAQIRAGDVLVGLLDYQTQTGKMSPGSWRNPTSRPQRPPSSTSCEATKYFGDL